MGMESPAKQPKTLLEAIRYFADLDVATEYVAKLRWPEGPVCPKCGVVDPKHYFLKTRRVWKCRACKKQFSVKVGTIFEDSPLGLDKWLPAVWLIANCKNGISSYELARDLGVTQKSAWFMLHRIRLAMQTGTFEKLSGQVEADETFIGGKARNMHKSKRAEKITGTGGSGKVAVMGLLERHGEVRTKVVPDTRSRTLQVEVRENVEPGSEVHTDALKSYRGLDPEYVHNVVDHAERYVDGHVHTNGLENFWSLLKRGIKGTYVSVEPYHLFRYLDEQAFRFNEREGVDGERFQKALGSVAGRRLTYDELTGKAVLE
ncbi:IS1595 family transposase [Rubrobacter tropicus]|uniref:IS1595 family transposase n=1 Tax=Rubrobacter tropicus TaxID=2653851 RepID=A0A6G8Q5J5_9ACTN|nr:IS1595 family transposase [Rubrobacter tropicus]QIN81689.1 IS1595 family transposase [Rubrobacter tropicus]